MGLRQTRLGPLVRSFAALAFLAFIAAQTLCFLHCHLGGGHGNSTPSSCHGGASTQGCHKGGGPHPPPGPSLSTVCYTLKNQLTSSISPTVVVREFCVLYLLTPYALALEATAIGSDVAFARHANDYDWVFTPEVCLGPASRSLAPPFVG